MQAGCRRSTALTARRTLFSDGPGGARGRKRDATDGNRFPPGTSFPPGGRKPRQDPSARGRSRIALGRSKLIESSVMRFRPLPSRNFNRSDGSGKRRVGEGERGRSPKSNTNARVGMFATSYSIILPFPPLQDLDSTPSRGQGREGGGGWRQTTRRALSSNAPTPSEGKRNHFPARRRAREKKKKRN